MNESKFSDILDLISENLEDDEILGNIKMILKGLIGENTTAFKDAWFEKKEIKDNDLLYSMIISMIKVLSNYIKNYEIGKIKELKEEMTKIFENSEYFEIYKLVRKLFYRLDPLDEYFYDIYWCVYFLGYKKEIPFNSFFIENLKEISEYDALQNSPYAKDIKEFCYDKIDKEFLTDFNTFMDLIFQVPNDDAKISDVIKKLKLRDKEKSEKGNSIIIKVTEPKNNNNNMIKSEEGYSPNGTSEQDETSNNEETEITTSIKTEKENDKDSNYDLYEAFVESFKNFTKSITISSSTDENISIDEKILMYFKRNNRLNAILLLKANLFHNFKLFRETFNIKRDLFSYMCAIQEYMINVSSLKSIIIKMKPPVIINVKRKLIDLFIFHIIKNNKKYFILNKDYCPNNSYLENIENNLENKNFQNKKNILKFIKECKNNKYSFKDHPIKITDRDISDLISYFSFFKKACSQVVHIGKTSLKYYDFSINNQNYNSTNVFNEYEKDLGKIKISYDNSIQAEQIGKKSSVIDIEYAKNFLFNLSNNNIDSYEEPFLEKIKLVKKEKKNNTQNLSKSISDSVENLIKIIENSSSNSNFTLDQDVFKPNEITFVTDAMKNFDAKIKSIIELSKLLKKEKDETKNKDYLTQMEDEFISLCQKEIQVKDDYLVKISENDIGRTVLLYFQFKYMKLKKLCDFSKVIIDVFSLAQEKEQNLITEKLAMIKNEVENYILQYIKDLKLNTGKDIFNQWKKGKRIQKYETLCAILDCALKNSTKFKIDEDYIIDIVSSCWLIKNGLDELVLN